MKCILLCIQVLFGTHNTFHPQSYVFLVTAKALTQGQYDGGCCRRPNACVIMSFPAWTLLLRLKLTFLQLQPHLINHKAPVIPAKIPLCNHIAVLELNVLLKVIYKLLLLCL